MLEEKDWFVKRTHKGAAWTGPLQYEDETGELMMLPTDLALVHDREFRPVVAEYYKDEERFASDFAKVRRDSLAANFVVALALPTAPVQHTAQRPSAPSAQCMVQLQLVIIPRTAQLHFAVCRKQLHNIHD